MLSNKFDGSVGFSIEGGVKDATHMRHLASEQNSSMPTVDTAHNHLLAARALHGAQAPTGTTRIPVLDGSALIAGTRVAAGLDPFDGGKASHSLRALMYASSWCIINYRVWGEVVLIVVVRIVEASVFSCHRSS